MIAIMKRQVRMGVFETNSSSTHAVTILTDEEYQKYRNGGLRISRNGELITTEAYQKALQVDREMVRKSYETNECAKKHHDSFESYWNSWYYGVKYDFDERYMDVEHSERVINGEKVHALSVYGYES